MAAARPANTAAPLDLLAQAGLRRTRAALAVLEVFLADPAHTLTHADLEAALAARGLSVNRVTIYRLLERLGAAGVLEKHSDDADRIWRFGLQAAEPGVSLPRFECDACHRHFSLPQASEPTKAVADQLLTALSGLGHVGQRVDLAIHGTCAGCVEPAAARG